MKSRAACALPNLSSQGVGVFGIGANNAMFYKQLTGNNWLPLNPNWLSLDGLLASMPAALQRVDQFVFAPDVFCLTPGNQATTTKVSFPSNPTSWPPTAGPWQQIGGVFNSPIEASAFGFSQGSSGTIVGNSIALVGLGTDNQPVLQIIDGPGPAFGHLTGWLPLGQTLIFEPAIAWFGAPDSSANTLDLFGVATDAQMYRLGVDANQWPPKLTGWQPAGGCFISAPTVVKLSSTRIDVFGIRNDQQMVHRAWDNGGWIEDWEALGGQFDSPAAVASWAPDRLDLFGLGTNDQMFHKWWAGGWMPSLTEWNSLGGAFVSAPVVASTGVNRLDLFGITTNNQMLHKAWRGGPDWSPPQMQWDAIGGNFTIPRPAQKPSQLDFDEQVTFSGSTPVGGDVHLTLLHDGTGTFSGHMHDSGFPDYDYVLVCQVVDAKGVAYRFEQSDHVSGTVSFGGSRDSSWSNNIVAMPQMAENWDDLFPCGGAQMTWYADVNVDTATLLASIATGGLTSVLNATFR